MKLTIECQAAFLVELYRAVRAACTGDFLLLCFQDDIMTIQDENKTFSTQSWVEIDITHQSYFKTYSVKSKHPKNRVVLKCVYNEFLEGLQASSSLAGTKVIIQLATSEMRVFLEFACEVPEDEDTFFYEKQVSVVIEKSNESIVPEIPNSIECELACSQRLQHFLFPVTGTESLLHICLTVEDCHVCRPKDSKDLDYVLKCSHNRKNFSLSQTCKLTAMSKETSPFQLICSFLNLNLQHGQCSLYNIKTLVKTKDLVNVLQKTNGLNWEKVMFGIQHESEIIISASWKASFHVRFIVSAQADE